MSSFVILAYMVNGVGCGAEGVRVWRSLRSRLG